MKSILDGIRVVEVAGMAAGPTAAVILADLGAEVIKIEPLAGDVWRYANKIPPMPLSDIAYTTYVQNRTKKSVALNLKDPAAQDVLHKLAATADVFLTNSPRKVQRELAHTYDEIKAIKPDIIYAWINGYGENGPDKDAPGYDATAWYARTGVMEELRAKDSDPVPLIIGGGDVNVSMALAFATIAGLFHKQRTGEGSYVSTSLLNCGLWTNSSALQAALVGAGVMEKFKRVDWPQPVNCGIFKTKDDRYVMIVEFNPHNWANLCDAFDADEMKDDPRFATPELRVKNHKDLFAGMDALVGQHDFEEVKKRLTQFGVNYGPVQTTEECTRDAHMNANGCFPEVEGTGGHRTVDSPVYVSGGDLGKVPPQKPPEVGEHTASELAALGYTEAEIKAMAEAKAIRVHG